MGDPFTAAIATFIKAIFIGASAGASTAYIFAVNVARLGLLALSAKLTAPKLDLSEAAIAKSLTIRDPLAPQRFGYGEDQVSGPIIFSNVAGSENRDLYIVIAMLGHEIDSVTKYRIDDLDIPLSDLSGAEDGTVDSGDLAGVAEVVIRKGTTTQAAISNLTSVFSGLFGANHTGRGWTYMMWKFSLVEGSEDRFKTQPQNIRAVMKMRKVYDPRLDSTNGGSGSHRLADDTTWEWSDNPAICLADYIRDDKFGMREEDDRIDWPKVITSADVCDEQVLIPPAASPSNFHNRYTCNATFSANETRGTVRDELLGAMLGRMVFSQGLWRMWAGEAITPDVTLTEANLAGAVTLEASTASDNRYNRVRGKFIDASRNYTAAPYPEARSSTFVTADGGEVREQVADFTSTNNEFEAQRKAIITLKQSRNQRIVVLQGNYSCFRIQPGTTVLLDIAEYGFSGEKFFVSEWKLSTNGIELTLVEEDDTVWSDPVISAYSTRSATGAITFGETGVPAATAFSGTSQAGGFLLQWTNPPESTFDAIEVWASDTNVRGNADLIATVRGSEYLDQVSDNRVRWYWIRVRNSFGQVSDFTPNLTTSTITGNAFLTTNATTPGFTKNFQYDDLDIATVSPTPQLAGGQSRYALLSDSNDNASGIQNTFANTQSILINKVDLNGLPVSTFMHNLRSRDRVVYFISTTRWYLFAVTGEPTIIGTAAGIAYKFPVSIIEFVDADPSVNQSASSGNTVEFQFFQPLDGTFNLLLDPDFDLTEGLNPDVNSHWESLYTPDSPSTLVFDFGPDGVGGSNAITWKRNDGGQIAITSKRRIRINAVGGFEVLMRYKTTDATGTLNQFVFQMAGFTDIEDTAAAETFSKVFTLPASLDVWTVIRVRLEQSSFGDGRFWNMIVHHNGTGESRKIVIDSVFVYQTSGDFADAQFFDDTDSKTYYTPGAVPKSDVSADANKVLQGDGTWSVLPINVRSYGAVGDGVADDFQAFVDAIAQAKLDGGLAVYAPAGIYEVSDSIFIDGCSGFKLFGDGPDATIIRAKVFASAPTTIEATEGVITIGRDSASDHVVLADLTIDAQGALQPVDDGDPDGEFHTLSLRVCSYVWLQNLRLLDGARDTLYLAGQALVSTASDLHHLFLSDLHIGGSANRRAFSVVEGVEDLVANNIFIDGNTNGSALAFEPGGGQRKCNRILMSNFVIDGGTSNVVMTSTELANTPEDIVLSNFYCRDASLDGMSLGAFKRLTLHNIELENPGGDGIETSTLSARSEDLQMQNVRINGAAGRGLWCRTVNRGTFDNVRVFSPTGVGIQVSSSGADFARNLRFINCITNDGSSNGFLIDALANKIDVINHHSENNTSAGLQINTTGITTDDMVRVMGGYFADNVSAGIKTTLASSFAGRIIIDGAHCTNTGSGGTQTHGIDMDSDTDYVRLVNCDLRGNSTGAVTGNVGNNGFAKNNIGYADTDALITLADDATPSIAGGNLFLTGGTTTITDFDDGVLNQLIEIRSEHAVTITDGTNIILNGSANFVMAAADSLILRLKADNKWYEVSRMVNL